MRLVYLFAVLFVAVSARVQKADVQFFLTNANNRFLQVRTGELNIANIDRTRDVKIISHGWVDDINSFWYMDTKNAYLRRGATNVIAIDWSAHANGLYSTAVNRIEDVGYFVALLIMDISDMHGIPLSRFHLIGHSLGAHLFGFTGQHLIRLRGQRVGRITGLDPAGPSFEGAPANRRISPDDATFVDILHTDGGVAGIRASVGHIDYYPHGGTARQNGCGLLQIGCSHNRAPILFHESVNSNAFVAVACANVGTFNNGRCNNNQRITMGENVDQTARGDFFLNTRASSPFGLGTI